MKQVTLPFLISVFFFCFPFTARASVSAETGGTDFSVYDLKEYGTAPTDANWPKVRFTIPHYHENPALIKSLLKQFCDAGQKKIGLTVWFGHLPADGSMLTSFGGKPTAQAEANIKNLLSDIKVQKASDGQPCFNEIQFRFANLGNASGIYWTTWNETQYQENKSFIWAIHNLIHSNLSGSSLKVYFDLGAELPGINQGVNLQYIERLWKDYTDAFGPADTTGFSIAWYPGRMKSLLDIYKKVGKYPPQFSVDVYSQKAGVMASDLAAMHSEMKAAGLGSYPVIVQETQFNDPVAKADITAAREGGMNIRTVMQWQLTRETFFRPDGNIRHFSTVSSDFSYYGDDFKMFSPTSLSYTCNGSQVTLKWNPVSLASTYSLRLDDTSNNNASCQYSWLCPSSTDILQDSLTSTTKTLPVVSGHVYKWWVHAVGQGGHTSAPTSQTFTCGAVVPGDLTGDGHVNLFDYNKLVSAFGNPFTIFDYNALVSNYGK